MINNLNQIVTPAIKTPTAPEAPEDKINNIILTIINDLCGRMCRPEDIDYITAAAENLIKEPVINFNHEELIKYIDSSEYLINQDGLFYICEYYNNTFFNSFINVSDLYDVELNYYKYDQDALSAYLDDIGIKQQDLFIDFLNVLEYQGVYLPDILYHHAIDYKFLHEFKNNQLNITYELSELIKFISEEKNICYVECIIESIEQNAAADIEEHITKIINQKIQQARTHANYPW